MTEPNRRAPAVQAVGRAADPLTVAVVGALRPVLAEVVREALAERQPAEAPPALLDRAALAAALSCSPSTVDRLRLAGLPTVRLCDGVRFELPAVLGWLRQRSGAGGAEGGAP
ncbi:MAG: hypothetical protein HY744_13670 [Deltaproteobacteria bacterium]|nr:hypothetical protein [Deltaproteobacteria bacterium]